MAPRRPARPDRRSGSSALARRGRGPEAGRGVSQWRSPVGVRRGLDEEASLRRSDVPVHRCYLGLTTTRNGGRSCDPCCSAVTCALIPAVVVAQTPVEPTTPPREVTILAGGGNSMGWWGIQAERYGPRRVLGICGCGARRRPDAPLSSNDNFAFAGGVRAGHTHPARCIALAFAGTFGDAKSSPMYRRGKR